MKYKAGFEIGPHNFTLIQQHRDSYRCCLKGSKMTAWYSSTEIASSWGAALSTALTISGPEWRGHIESKRDEASVCTLHFKAVL